MGRQNHLAVGQAEVHLADQLEDFGELVEEADVDQRVLRAAVDEVNIHPKSASGLDIELDDARKDITTFDHTQAISTIDRTANVPYKALAGHMSWPSFRRIIA